VRPRPRRSSALSAGRRAPKPRPAWSVRPTDGRVSWRIPLRRHGWTP